MSDHLILGVHVTDRVSHASDVQKLFTEYGANIKTRIGLHDVSGGICKPGGVIVLELYGDPAACQKLRAALGKIDGIEVQAMQFTHHA
jgi:hypothetical protein